MPLATRCHSQFSSSLRAKGSSYFSSGRVKINNANGAQIEATVKGTRNYTVTLDGGNAKAGELGVYCSCPYFEGVGSCKHLWALILAADLQGHANIAPGSNLLELVDTEDGYDSDEDDYDEYDDDDPPYVDARHWQRPGLQKPRVVKQSPKAQANAWRVQLQSLGEHASGQRFWNGVPKQRQWTYVIDVGASQAAGQFTLRVLQQESKRNGELGTLKNVEMEHVEYHKFAQHSDRELLAWLATLAESSLEQRYYSYSYRNAHGGFHVPHHALPMLLPLLDATGRLFWMLDSAPPLEASDLHRVAWDSGPPWDWFVQAEADDKKKQWVLTGKLRQVGTAETVDLKVPVWITNGFVLWQDRITAFAPTSSPSWMSLLRREERICVPFAARTEFLDSLYQHGDVPEIVWPEEVAYQPVQLGPRPRLIIHAPDKSGFGVRSDLRVKVHFQYGDVSVPCDSKIGGIPDHAGKRILLRDGATEQQHLAMLRGRGFNDQIPYGLQAHLMLPSKLLAKTVADLVAAGWDVEAEGNLIRSAGQFNISVNSGVDWFELEGDCDFGGVAVTLPEVLAALRKGETFIRLGDGTQGLLPEQWLKRYGAIAELANTDEDGKVRFRPSQAMLLDALLASQENVTFDRSFRDLRKKIQAFSGISPQAAPRGFVGELRPYQQDGLGWFRFLQDFRFGGCLADDMGLGKTIQVLALLEGRRTRRLKKDETRRPSLVVVPRSLIFNWLVEAASFAPQLKILDFSRPARNAHWESLTEYDVVLTTYGTLLRDITKLHKVEFDYAIVDEAQAIKNATSQSAKACRLLNAQHRLAMTGTPVENHLGELWSILDFLNPGMLGRSTAFSKMMDTGAEEQDRASSLSMLSRAVAPFILRRTKQQVLKDLPEKTEQTIHCDLSTEERKKYNELRDYYRASLGQKIAEKGMAQAKIHVLEALLRLRQASCHLGLLDAKLKKKTSAKLEVLFEQLDELAAEGHKALVFSQFTSLLAIVREHLDQRKIRYEYLDGQTRDRQARVDHFQNDDSLPLFLISLKAGGRGLNLTAADYVFILDPWWNPAVEAQAVDRAHRIGQTKPVFAYRIIARDTVEEKILELQRSKRDLADAIITADSGVLKSLTADDLQMLLQ